MRRLSRGFVVAGTILLLIPAIAKAEISAEQVNAAIDRAVAYIKRQQTRDGTWPNHAGQPGGVTALCTLALLNAGVDPAEECIKKALSTMRGVKPQMTYTTALQTMVLCAAEPQKDKVLIRRNAKWLEDTQIKTGDSAGGWSYPTEANFRADNSNSQFALLALHEAERAGVPINDKTWRLALDYWLKCQEGDGSWGYVRGIPGTGSMTCAGIASVIIASGELNAGDAVVTNDQARCCGEQLPNAAVENALLWLDKHFSVTMNPGAARQPWLFYYLYGIERTGRMTARRFIGKHDWYREGTDYLIRQQDKLTGIWKGDGHAENNPDIGTSLALLFLLKGRRPVLMAKLKHGPGEDWNHHRSDTANLTFFVEKAWKRDLTWQIIDADAASVEDLLQSPVLFLNGRQAPEFSAEEKRRLRDYVDRGGFIFAEACCGGTAFEKGFRKLMNDVFPEEEYKLRLLPPEHPVWHAEQPVHPQYVRPLWGIDIGCRTSVVFCSKDLSCYWELGRLGRESKLPASVQAEVAACYAIGINVLAYATNREVKNKIEVNAALLAEPQKDTFARGKVYVAKLLHPGGCNAAPAALVNLLRVAGDKLQIRISSEPREVAISDAQLFNYHLAFMHGRHSFRLTPVERKAMRTYLDRGGMLFADAICSSKEFNESFRREMQLVFPEQALARIPATHGLFTREYGGEDITTVSRRQPDQAGAGEPLKSRVREGEPYLEGIQLGDRYAVIFSPYDLSCALESHESLECEGYIRRDAARIGLNVLLYSLHQ